MTKTNDLKTDPSLFSVESNPTMPHELLTRYLALLGVPKRKPSLVGLRQLVQAHLCRVPFENISKLYYMWQRGLRGLPELELYLDGIEHFNFGGTCYANNYYFYQLLANLGYQAKLCGADMTNPDVHLVTMVEVKKRQFLVDVGYAAPFIKPMPRDLTIDLELRLGRDRYVLKPQDNAGRSRMILYRGGQEIHGYLAKPEPRVIAEFNKVIADSFRDEATFMKAILLARFYPNRSLVIHNYNVVRSQKTSFTINTLTDRRQLYKAIEEGFGIPSRVTCDVLDKLETLGDAWT